MNIQIVNLCLACVLRLCVQCAHDADVVAWLISSEQPSFGWQLNFTIFDAEEEEEENSTTSPPACTGASASRCQIYWPVCLCFQRIRLAAATAAAAVPATSDKKTYSERKQLPFDG